MEKERRNNLRLSQAASRVSGSVIDGTFEAVEPVTVIELIDWFSGRVVSQVVLGIDLGSKEPGELASPVPQLHLIVGVIRPNIKQE